MLYITYCSTIANTTGNFYVIQMSECKLRENKIARILDRYPRGSTYLSFIC